MKVALVCDWLVSYAGAEKVIEQILYIFPEADIFSIVDFLGPAQRGFIHNKKVATSFIQHLPLSKKYYRHYLPLMPLAIEQLDVSKYDLVISSSHAVAKGIITGPDQLHICYIHTPMRYAWDLQHEYLSNSGLNQGMRSWVAKAMLHYMRIWDSNTSNGVDWFVANSQFVARRILKTYRRRSTVIYPPVDTDVFNCFNKKEDFYLTASRMVPYKRVDLIVEAFSHMPNKRLIVIGDGPEFNKIRGKAASNVELIGYQPLEILRDYMQKAKAFVFAAKEDFGITPVEAQACGTPVIAYGKGGVCESVLDMNHQYPTGIFYDKQDVNSIIEAIYLFENSMHLYTPDNCRNNALRFSIYKFRNRFADFIKQKIDEFGQTTNGNNFHTDSE